MISQLPKALGFSIDAEGPLRSALAIIRSIWSGVGIAGDVMVALDALGTPEDRRVPTPAVPQEFDDRHDDGEPDGELFQERVRAAVAQSPTKVRRVVVAAEPVTSVDVTAADALAELNERLRKDGIELAFAELKDPVKDKLRRFDLYERFGERGFFPTIESAVEAYCQTHGIEPAHSSGLAEAALGEDGR